MDQQARVLHIFNVEYGQANAQLAIIHELLIRGVEVHVSSFEGLRARLLDFVEENGHLFPQVDGKPRISFYPINTISMNQATEQHLGTTDRTHKTGLSGIRQMGAGANPWTGPQYLDGFWSIVETIKNVNPTIIVVDGIFAMGMDAVSHLGRVKDLVITEIIGWRYILQKIQPTPVGFYKFPAVCSGHPYPVPWYLIPRNIFLQLYTIFRLFTDPIHKEVLDVRKGIGLPGPLLPMHMPPGMQYDGRYVTSSLPELDYPLKVIPNWVDACGPIILPPASLAQKDPELAQWLKKRPTVMINRGTHNVMDSDSLAQTAAGIRLFLDSFSDHQVLWKLKTGKDSQRRDVTGQAVQDILGKEVKEGRVRVASWIAADPISLLNTGSIVCSVHHGGANTFNEALVYGVPQVVLPTWFDTYDNAALVSWLQVGVHGSRRAAPGIEAVEFSNALKKAVSEPEIRLRSKELQEVIDKAGIGRVLAAEAIIKRMHERIRT